MIQLLSRIWLALVLSFLAGCARPDPPADLVVINGMEPETLDPALCTGQPDAESAALLQVLNTPLKAP